MNTDRIISALIDLADAYPNYTLQERTIAKYLRHLDDLPDDVIISACDVAATTCKFFPSVAELRACVTSAVIDEEAEIDRAWIEVQAEARRVGHNRPTLYIGGVPQAKPQATFSNPLIAQAVASVSWPVICLGNNEKGEVGEMFKRAYRRQLRSAGRMLQTGQDGASMHNAIAGAGLTLNDGLRGAQALQEGKVGNDEP